MDAKTEKEVDKRINAIKYAWYIEKQQELKARKVRLHTDYMAALAAIDTERQEHSWDKIQAQEPPAEYREQVRQQVLASIPEPGQRGRPAKEKEGKKSLDELLAMNPGITQEIIDNANRVAAQNNQQSFVEQDVPQKPDIPRKNPIWNP